MSDLCCRYVLPTLQDSCTWRNPRGRNTFLHYCMCWSHTDSHLNRGNMIANVCLCSSAGGHLPKPGLHQRRKHVWTANCEGIVILEQRTNANIHSVCVNTQFVSEDSDVFNAVSYKFQRLTWVAGFPLPVINTHAVEVIEEINTLAPILTGESTALVHVWNQRQQKIILVHFTIKTFIVLLPVQSMFLLL